MNYIMNGVQALKESIFIGLFVYIAILALLYLFKRPRKLSWECVPEAIFCIYGVTLLKLTGIFTLHLSLKGPFSFNFVPFVGSSIVPILLNFALFFPLGFLLPLIFHCCRRNWKRTAIICGITSLAIELLQLFGGRHAEIEDLIINTLGGFSGHIVYSCISEKTENRKKAFLSFVSLCLALTLCFIGIYAIGDNEKTLPDGLSAVEDSIAEINLYSGNEKRTIDRDSYIYRSFESQISNCGGHLMEIQETTESGIRNSSDCFIEIVYASAQTITFENAENFSIDHADRLLYNADRNLLYWGNAGYQYCTDYAMLDEQMQAYKEDILKNYAELAALIRNSFNQQQ